MIAALNCRLQRTMLARPQPEHFCECLGSGHLVHQGSSVVGWQPVRVDRLPAEVGDLVFGVVASADPEQTDRSDTALAPRKSQFKTAAQTNQKVQFQ